MPTLDNSGLTTETQQELFDKIAARLRSKFGVNLVTDVESIVGQIIHIMSELHALNQQTLLAVYKSLDPNSATGVSLVHRCALTGTVKKGEANSTVVGVLTFGSAGTANNGDLINNDDNDTQWELVDGPHVSAGPWPEQIAATFQAVDPGEVLANAGTTWSLVSAIPGVNNFTNPTEDANQGRDEETDVDLRKRRLVERFSANVGSRGALRAAISKVAGVDLVRVYHNPRDYPTDSDGIPFKAFNPVVKCTPSPPSAATQQAIADAIVNQMGAGGESYGTDYNLSVTDVEGQVQSNIRFDLADEVDVYVLITLDTAGAEEVVTENLDTVVKDEVVSYVVENFEVMGRDVRSYQFVGIVDRMCREGIITGVTDITVQLSVISLGGPFINPVPIGIREIPDFDTVNISVVVTS